MTSVGLKPDLRNYFPFEGELHSSHRIISVKQEHLQNKKPRSKPRGIKFKSGQTITLSGSEFDLQGLNVNVSGRTDDHKQDN